MDLVTMAEVIAAVETALADISSGTAAQPSPAAPLLPLDFCPASFLAMVALADRQGLARRQASRRRPRKRGARQLPVQRSVAHARLAGNRLL